MLPRTIYKGTLLKRVGTADSIRDTFLDTHLPSYEECCIFQNRPPKKDGSPDQKISSLFRRLAQKRKKTKLPKGVRDWLIQKHQHKVGIGNKQTLINLVNSKLSIMKKQQRVWQCTQTKFLLAFSRLDGTLDLTPAEQKQRGEDIDNLIIKWWVRQTNLILKTGRTQPAVDDWKQFSSTILRYYGKQRGNPEAVQTRLIRDMTNKAEGKWPYWPIPNTWTAKAPDDMTRRDIRNCIHFAYTRDLPAADDIKQKEMLQEHLANTMEPEHISGTRRNILRETELYPLTEGQREEIARIARIAGREIRQCAEGTNFFKKMTGHISISSSSCLQSTRKDGGKRAFILNELTNWLQEVWTEDDVELLHNVVPSDTSDECIVTRDLSGAEDSFRVLNPLGETFNITLKTSRHTSFSDLGDNFGKVLAVGETPLGFDDDKTISSALFNLCWMKLIECGILDSKGQATGNPYFTERSIVAEPGGKARIVTKVNVYLVTYLQPFAHVFKDYLQTDPTLKEGFEASNHAYSFAKRAGGGSVKDPVTRKYVGRRPLREEGQAILFGDYKTATDKYKRNRLKVTSDNFFIGSFGSRTSGRPNLSNYALGCLDVVQGPWVNEGYVTRTAIPMGIPVTKPLLHLSGKCIHMHATGVIAPRSPEELWLVKLAIAGDDIIIVDDEEVLEKVPGSVYLFGLTPQTRDSKWGIYDKFHKYCECGIICDTGLIWKQTPSNIDEDCVNLDVIKIRLTSRETKFNKGDEDRVALWGKCKKLMSSLRTFRGGTDGYRIDTNPKGRRVGDFNAFPGQFELAHYLLIENSIMEKSIGVNILKSPFLQLPSAVGGLGFTPVGDKKRDELLDLINNDQEYKELKEGLVLTENLRKRCNHVAALEMREIYVRSPGDPVAMKATTRQVSRAISSFGNAKISDRGVKPVEEEATFKLLKTLSDFNRDNDRDHRIRTSGQAQRMIIESMEQVGVQLEAPRQKNRLSFLEEYGYYNAVAIADRLERPSVWNLNVECTNTFAPKLSVRDRARRVQKRLRSIIDVRTAELPYLLDQDSIKDLTPEVWEALNDNYFGKQVGSDLRSDSNFMFVEKAIEDGIVPERLLRRDAGVSISMPNRTLLLGSNQTILSDTSPS